MHARELVELAAIVSAHGPALIRSGNSISADSIEQYWTTSKVRLDRWARRLKTYSSRSARGIQDLDQPHAEREEYVWPEVRGVLEEILTERNAHAGVDGRALCLRSVSWRRRGGAGGTQRVDRPHGGSASRVDVHGSRAGHRRRGGREARTGCAAVPNAGPICWSAIWRACTA